MTIPNRITPELISRFWSRVNVIDGSCWEWRAGRIRSGYGILCFRGEQFYAHRLSWEIHNGPIPDGLFVLHSCDNPGCVNPKHLSVGSPAMNTRDCIQKGRHAFGERHGSARLTRDDVLAIRASVAAGEPHADVARRFGVDGSTISLIVNRKRWVHV